MAYFGTIPNKADGTEGYASLTLTLKKPDSEIKTIACIIKNDSQLQDMQSENQSDLYVTTHKDTKFFLYFYCTETDLTNRLVETRIVAHCFTTNKDKVFTIENKEGTKPFFVRDNHVFLPACHKKIKNDFKFFLENHSKAVTLIENLSVGKYRGVQNSNATVKFLSFSLSSGNIDTLNITKPADTVLVDGPLLFEKASERWSLIGWYKNASEEDQITVFNLKPEDTKTKKYLRIQLQPDPPTSTICQPNPHGSTGLPSSTICQPNPHGSTGLPSSTISQPNPHGSTGLPTSTISQPNPHGSTGLPTSTISKPNPKNNATFSIKGTVKVLTVGGLAVPWAEVSAYMHIICCYINHPETLLRLIQEAIIPSAFLPVTTAFVYAMVPGSFEILVEVRSLVALDEIWKSYIEGDMKKKLEKVLITDDMRKLAPDDTVNVDISLMISEDEYKKARDYLVLEAVKGSAKTMDAIGELQENVDKVLPLPSPRDKDLLIFIIHGLKEQGVQRERINIDKNRNEVQIYGRSEAEIAAGEDQVKFLIQDYYLHNKQRGKVISTEGMTKVGIPEKYIGLVIGKEHANLRRIGGKTGAEVYYIDRAIYVGGSDDQHRKTAIDLKTTACIALYKDVIKKKFTVDIFDFVDGTGPECNYRLEPTECPKTYWHHDGDYYKIDKVDEDEDNEIANGEIDMKDLESTMTKVLQKIQTTVTTDGSSTFPKSDFWLHFGHVFIIGNVDEADQGETYLLDDFQKQLNQKKGWRMVFDSAVENMEVKGLEEALAGNEYIGIPPHTRYDMSFLTPSCSRIRVKIFLDADNQPTKKFIHEFIDVRPDHSTSAPYLLCDRFYHRAKFSIAIPSRSMDVRMHIRTVSTCLTKTRQELDEETKHTEVLKTYLDRIEIQNGEIKLPDDLPDDFWMFYLRKCKRRSYSYDKGGESFTIVISEEQEIDPWNAGKQFDVKTDIHVNSDEINKLLRSGEWEPEQIISRLPTFLSVVREIQANISASEDC